MKTNSWLYNYLRPMYLYIMLLCTYCTTLHCARWCHENVPTKSASSFLRIEQFSGTSTTPTIHPVWQYGMDGWLIRVSESAWICCSPDCYRPPNACGDSLIQQQSYWRSGEKKIERKIARIGLEKCILVTSMQRSRPISSCWHRCILRSKSMCRMAPTRRHASIGEISMPPENSRARCSITIMASPGNRTSTS